MIPTQPENRAPDERRGRYRYPVSGSRRAGRLKLGDRESAVEIVDESAGGFAVDVDESLGCEAGQVVLLKCASGWTEARVVNVRPQTPSEAASCGIDGADGETPAAEARVRLGLVRLRDLETSQVEKEPPAAYSWRDVLRSIRPLAPFERVLAVTLGLIIGASLLFMLVWTLEHAAPVGRAESEDAEQMAVTKEPRKRSAAPLAAVPRVHESTKPRGHVRTNKTDSQEKSEPEKPSAPSIVQSLFKPQEKDSLALSPDQLSQLRKSFDEYQAVAASGESGAHGDDDPEVQFGRRCLEIFTEKQRGSLMRLLARPGFLFKPEVTKLLALNTDQLDQLRQNLEAYRVAVDDGSSSSAGKVAPRSAEEAEIEFGRRSLALLSEKQRGTLMRWTMADLLHESSLPSQPGLTPQT